MDKVVITGLGALSALGVGAESLFAGALAGRSGIVSWPPGEARGTGVAAPFAGDLSALAGTLSPDLDRHVTLAILAAGQALADAGVNGQAEESGERCGVYWGTGVGSAGTVEESYGRLHHQPPQRPRPMTILLAMQNAAVAQIALEFGLRGPQLSVSQACASAAAAIGEAFLALRQGRADRIVVGGSEAPLVSGQFQAWEALRVLVRRNETAPEASCRPFDTRRSGLVLGEGAGALVLERLSVARARGARIYGELCGYGNAGDASYHARPDPIGQRRAMALALADARLAPEAVGYINAHATATQVGDAMEAQAIAGFFMGGPGPAISSTKAVHGHTLGAAGALELIVTTLALARGQLPPTAHLDEPGVVGLDLIRGEARSVAVQAALSNTFAFGGSNVCLALRRLPS